MIKNGNYRHLISLFDHRDTESVYSADFKAQLRETPRVWTPPTDNQGSRFDQMVRLQFGHWLPDNMLMRNDKMSMASSIEGRVPFLDHELVEFSFRLPRKHKIRRLTGKYLMRKLAERVLPKDTANRKKMPFYVPIEQYFQDKAFVELMDDCLGEESVRRRGIFDPKAVAQLRDSLRQNEFVLVKQAYSLMTLELWFRIFVDGGGNFEAGRPAGSAAGTA
ncbi:MAG: asparagine synthase C-terminal domain-containing protein [Planctomycetota bacterium]